MFQEKLLEINRELVSLNQTFAHFIPKNQDIEKLINKLKEINLTLWDIEDRKRLAEKNNEFGENFILLARNVYKFNDERAEIKLKINEILGSNIKEIKSHN